MEEFSGLKKSIFFRKGEAILEEGQNPKGVFCLKTGKCKLFTRGFNGKEQILRIVQSGDVIGYRSLLSEEQFSASAVALEDTWACFIPEVYFTKVLTHNPKLNKEIMKVAMHELGEAGKQITSLAQKTVRERLADEFLHLEDRMGLDEEGFINISLTREEIANVIGTATESAIRLISEFKSDGLIEVKGRRFRLLDREKLRKISTF
ncbi:CRP-like cAMP-activated global transcriptional regulator [Flavobacteriaceae bacterium UJ101]|nr:CRP-like cAMP-activated global transcriptional regulator [Flavobacteriaceae bacterium UJ101]